MFYKHLGSESSEAEEEDSESDLDELKTLSLPSDGLSVADLILQATQQSSKNLQVRISVFKKKYLNKNSVFYEHS